MHEMTDGFPHVYRVAADLLPPGLLECGCCGQLTRHGEVAAYDEDLAAYLCQACWRPVAHAEYALTVRAGCGCRRPEMMETIDLDDVERREMAGGGGGES